MEDAFEGGKGPSSVGCQHGKQARQGFNTGRPDAQDEGGWRMNGRSLPTVASHFDVGGDQEMEVKR